MDGEVCGIGLKERIDDRSALRLARHFLQASICGIASTKRSDNELRANPKR